MGTGLRRLFREYNEAWKDLEYVLDEVIDVGERIVSASTFRGRGLASGAEVDGQTYGVWTIRGGKIVRVEWFPERTDAVEAARALE